MEQSVCMSLPDARPIAHLLLNSSVTARAAVVPRPNNKAPAKADVMFLRIGFVLGVAGWGHFPPSFIPLNTCPVSVSRGFFLISAQAATPVALLHQPDNMITQVRHAC